MRTGAVLQLTQLRNNAADGGLGFREAVFLLRACFIQASGSVIAYSSFLKTLQMFSFHVTPVECGNGGFTLKKSIKCFASTQEPPGVHGGL